MSKNKAAVTEPTKRRYAKRLAPADRRAQLLDVALQIVAESGFTGVSIAAVAERGGVTRPVVYDSFASRDELLEELIKRETERMAEAVERSMVQVVRGAGKGAAQLAALRTALGRFLGEVQAAPDTWRLVYFPIAGVPAVLRDRVEKARDELRTPLREALTTWLSDRPEDAAEVDLEVLVRIVQNLVQTSARLVLDDPDRFDVARITGLFDYLLGENGSADPS